jgi:hypothetical protein
MINLLVKKYKYSHSGQGGYNQAFTEQPKIQKQLKPEITKSNNKK